MSEPTHIAVVLDNSFTSDLRVEKEINSLLHAGFRVTLFCFKEEGLAERETQANGLKIVRILDTWLTHPLRRGYTSGLKRTADAIISTSPQAIHCHDMYTLPIGGMLKRTHPQLTFVYDSHEYFRESRYYQDAPGWINRFGGKLSWLKFIRQERIMSRRADLVITTTNAICDALRRHNNLKCPIIPVRNIPALKPSDGIKQDLRTILQIKNGHVLVQTGNIYQSDEVLKTTFDEVLEIPNLSFVLIGNRPKFYNVKEWASTEKKYAGRIHFVDYEPQFLHDHLSSADIGLCYVRSDIWESHRITSPNRVMEYALCGIPIISVDQVVSNELKDKYGNVLIYDSNKAGSLKQALTEMLTQFDEFKQKSQSISKDLSWDAEFAPVLDYYNENTSSK